jgi:hypothetical protein
MPDKPMRSNEAVTHPAVDYTVYSTCGYINVLREPHKAQDVSLVIQELAVSRKYTKKLNPDRDTNDMLHNTLFKVP